MDQYVLEGGVGTLRYMSPEVATGCPYGKPCDVYSFALVAWEILVLEKPYLAITVDEFHAHVHEQQQRPLTMPAWMSLTSAQHQKCLRMLASMPDTAILEECPFQLGM